MPVKRVDVFLAAARAVVDAYPNSYAFYVIGDGPLRQELEAMAGRLALVPHLKFTGFLANSLPVLRRMGVLVLTSDHEGTPIVALEALVLGVPVVAHAVGGLVPLLRSPEQGQLVWSQEPALIARAMIAAAPPDQPIAASRPNLLPVQYAIEKCGDSHLALYNSLIRGAR